jgi:Domain of unknown function (DUF5667)
MTPLFLARRSAERFDSQVEGARREDVDRATADLLELVGALRAVPQAQARPEFVGDLRERLMLAAATELTPVETPARRDDVARLTVKHTRSRRERRVGVALGAAAIIGATTSMAVASQSAIPGDALYPVKRAIENVQSGFSVGDDAKGETMLGNASTRLDEVDELTQQKSPDARLVTQTLKTFSQQFTDGSNALLADYSEHGDPASIQQIHQNAADSTDTLSGLEGVIPPAAHDALVDAAQSVFAADAEALNLCGDPACGQALLDVPSTLLAGATEQLNGALDDVAGGQLPGTTPPATPTEAAQPQQGVKDQSRPSGLNPPETPITLPAAPTSDAAGGLGQVITGDGHSGTGTGTGPDGTGGKGGKGGKHHVPVDLTPVTTTVNEVVNGVVDGVTGILNGLTGDGS